MSSEHIIIRIGIGNRVCRKLERDLNAKFSEGYRLAKPVEFRRLGWLRFMLTASLLMFDQEWQAVVAITDKLKKPTDELKDALTTKEN